MAFNNRGIAFIMSFFVILVISILAASFFSAAMNENKLVVREIASTRAFWLAEAGVAQALVNMPNDVSGTLGGVNYLYSTEKIGLPINNEYYKIRSTGTVNLGNLGQITRVLNTVVRVVPVDPSKFQYTIMTTGGLQQRGNVDIETPPGYKDHFSFNFADLFQHTKDDIKSSATNLYTNPPNNVTPVSGITWVELTPGQELHISDNNWSGSGILVVAGDAMITGGTFNGIIYVIGTLRMSGNPVIHGTVLVENRAVIDETLLTGKVNLDYDIGAITSALTPLSFLAPVVVSWEEN